MVQREKPEVTRQGLTHKATILHLPEDSPVPVPRDDAGSGRQIRLRKYTTGVLTFM